METITSEEYFDEFGYPDYAMIEELPKDSIVEILCEQAADEGYELSDCSEWVENWIEEYQSAD
jgi:hypothetical protein